MSQNWPDKADSTTTRAQKVATAYRELGRQLTDKEITGEEFVEKFQALESQMRAWGQHWILGTSAVFDDDEWVGPDIAADILGVTSGTVSSLRIRGLLKARPDGRTFEFHVGTLRAYIPLLGRNLTKVRQQARQQYIAQLRAEQDAADDMPAPTGETTPGSSDSVSANRRSVE